MSIGEGPMPRWYPFMVILSIGALWGIMNEPEWRRGKEYERMSGNIQGTVIKEEYTPCIIQSNSNPKSTKLNSKDTLRIDSKYTLKIKTEEGDTLAVSVVDGPSTKKESLDALVNVGSIISFPKTSLVKWGSLRYERLTNEDTFFDYTTHGSKRANRIKLLK